MPDTEVHISSLLLRADPADMAQVIAAAEAIPYAEVPLSDASGKIIVAMETPSEQEIVDAMTRLQLTDGVVSAALIYHQTDSDIAGGSPAAGQA
jgi:nitrate reductase NapD